MNRFAKMKKERIYTLFETLSKRKDLHTFGDTIHYQLWMMIVYLSDICFKKMETKKSLEYLLETLFLGGLDGTRTRDPMRDRHVF